MAKIVLGMATSHGPLLSTPPEQWGERVKADRANPALWFRGQPYKYDALETLRVVREARAEIGSWPNVSRATTVAARRWLRSPPRFEKVNPDVVVIVGNDQQEAVLRQEHAGVLDLLGRGRDKPPADRGADGEDAAGLLACHLRAPAGEGDALSLRAAASAATSSRR